MTGDYTKVALRAHERWETAPAQQGRALLDHELNLNPAASVRRDRRLARDAIGAAGVRAGSTAFEIGVASAAPFELSVGEGHMWVDGLAAVAPAPFEYADQDQIAPLPATGRALVYLDVWEEHVHPAEDPDIVDPALAPTDTAARTRVGYRVRAITTTALSCQAAWAGFDPAPSSTGALSVHRVGPAAPPDPCDPPGDAQGLVPDGLLRVEVLDGGNAGSARFAWSYENGAAAVPVAAIAGSTVTLAPSSSVKFANDLVEVSWLARRADRLNAGSLYQITAVTPSATGDVLTLDRAVTAPAGAAGLAVRRWDGEVIGATADVAATRGGNDLGIRIRAGAGNYRPGDWWAARIREADGVEPLADAPPDGSRHAFAPLALVDIDSGAVLDDCRPTFEPLTELELGSPCTVVVRPGDDLQAAVDSLPGGGGEVCLSAGTFDLTAPIVIANRSRVRVAGVGPSTIVRAAAQEVVFRYTDSDDVELRDLALVAGIAGNAADADGLNGAATFEGCRGVTVDGVAVRTPDGGVRRQTAITVRGHGTRGPERVRIGSCDLVVGAWQVGVLVVDGLDVVVDGNHVGLAPSRSELATLGGRSVLADEIGRMFARSLDPAQDTPTRTIRLPSGRRARLAVRSPVGALADAFAQGPARPGSDDVAELVSFAGTAMTNPSGLAAPAFTELQGLGRTLAAVGQAIVVGGRQTASVRISGNTIRGAVQGIHVGTSHPGGGRERAGEVLISGNMVHLAVPATHARERHAVFVGNADSIQVTDTRATISRTAPVPGVDPTPVDAVRLFGSFGPFVSARGVSVDGFHVGVRAEPLGAAPTRRVWSISEVMAAGLAGATGALAPATFNRTLVAP